jgi:hypothetical protein
VVYMHYMGHGPASQLAASLKAALAISKTPLDKPAAAVEEATPPSWVKAVEDSDGRKGACKGGVLSYGVPRGEPVTMGGMTVAPAAGVAEAINFQAADSGTVATTGDFVLTADEVNPVIAELQTHHILIPPPTDSGLPAAQKCMKNSRGCSVSMWLCAAALKHVSTK